MSIIEYAKQFDHAGKYRRKVDIALEQFRQFRCEYPFKTYPDSIDNLTPRDLYDKGGDYFFKWIVFTLKDLGHLHVYATVFQKACEELKSFKTLLRVVVRDDLSVAEKVDAPWGTIKGMGGDQHLAKKIIYCYNEQVLPIYRTQDLELFFTEIVQPTLPAQYRRMSLGEKFQYLNSELVDAKQNVEAIESWDNPYFMWFLYVSYKWKAELYI